MACHGSETRRSLWNANVYTTASRVRQTVPNGAPNCVASRQWPSVSVEGKPSTMAARGAAEELEDATKLELGAEFDEARVLMIAEVNVVLATYQSKNEVQGVEDKPNAIFEKCDEVSRPQSRRRDPPLEPSCLMKQLGSWTQAWLRIYGGVVWCAATRGSPLKRSEGHFVGVMDCH